MIHGFHQCTKSIFDSALAFSGEAIDYVFRKTGQKVTLTSLRTEPGRDEQGDDGKRLHSSVVVWTFYVSALNGVLPQPGDVIVDSRDNQYDVLPVDGTLYELRDPYGMIIKLNTKRSNQQWAA